jgi:hypothetical protein
MGVGIAARDIQMSEREGEEEEVPCRHDEVEPFSAREVQRDNDAVLAAPVLARHAVVCRRFVMVDGKVDHLRARDARAKHLSQKPLIVFVHFVARQGFFPRKVDHQFLLRERRDGDGVVKQHGIAACPRCAGIGARRQVAAEQVIRVAGVGVVRVHGKRGHR